MKRRLLASLLTISMFFGTTVSAFAEETEGNDSQVQVEIVSSGEGQDSSSIDESSTPEEPETTEDEGTTEETPEAQEDLILNRPDQSKEVEDKEGNPTEDKNKDPDVVLPTGYDVLLQEDGIFRVTYTIQKDCDVEKVYIDLNKAMDYAKQYCGMTDSTWLEPGDTRIVQVYIQSESGHTYKYADGSFTLTTADLGTNQTQKDESGKPTIETPEEGDVVGFDKQVLDDNHTGKDSFALAITSPSVEALFVQLGFFTQDDADKNLQKKTLSYVQYIELKNYLQNTYGTDDVTEGMQKYLLEYYSEQDGIEYSDFNTMMKNSSQANKDLYSGTQANRILGFDSMKIQASAVANTLIGNSSATMSVRFPALQNLLNSKLGTSYSFTGTSSQNWTRLKNALIADGYDDLAALVPTSYSNTQYVLKYLQIYNKLYESDTAATDAYLTEKGYNYADFDVRDVTSYSGYILQTKSNYQGKIECPLDPATRYNNFYQNLLSVLIAGTREKVDAVTGGQSGTVQTSIKYEYTVTDADDGQTYTNCVPASELGPDFLNFVTSLGYPENTLACADNYVFGFRTSDGQIATTDNYDGEVSEVYESEMPEYENDSWSSDYLAPQLADYMTKGGPLTRNMTAWDNANALFNQLLGEGITAGQAAITAFMAYNLDGRQTGNDYQDTEWSWASSIALERIDGELHLQKVDEDNNVITSSETEFALWKIEDEVDDEGNTVEKKYYLQYKTENDNVVYAWVEATGDDMNVTISTKNGLLDIKYALLEDIIYYLQEVVAPKGYDLDPTIYIICNEEDYDEACSKLSEEDKTKYLGSIDSENPLEVKIVNKPTPEEPEEPEKPEKPKEKTPSVPTGYDNNVTRWEMLLLASALGIGVAGMSAKRRKPNK